MEGEVTTQADEVEVQPQTEVVEEAPQVEAPQEELISKSEYQKVVEESERVKKELEHVKNTQSGYDRAYSKLSTERNALQAQISSLQSESSNQKMELIAKSQVGELDETRGNLTQQLAKIDTETRTKRDQLESQRQVQEYARTTGETIRTILREGGIDPDNEDDAAVKGIRDEWQKAVTGGTPLDSVFAQAAKAVAQKARSSVSVDDIKKDAELAANAKLHQSPALKSVSTGKPQGSTMSDTEFLDRYSKGEVSDHKRAKEILSKQ